MLLINGGDEMKTMLALVISLAMVGCIGSTMENIESLPNDSKGAKILYQGDGDEIAAGGGKGVHYERNF